MVRVILIICIAVGAYHMANNAVDNLQKAKVVKHKVLNNF